MQINPYLTFNGNCKEAFEFYAQVLGGKINAMLPHAGTPAEGSVPAEWGEKIMHAHMSIGSTVLMASDAPPQHYPGAPRGFSINIAVEKVEDAERMFQQLSEGGKVHMPLAKTFWAERFGMLVDKFDIPWMINCEGAK